LTTKGGWTPEEEVKVSRRYYVTKDSEGKEREAEVDS
jgi:hypothetical protein